MRFNTIPSDLRVPLFYAEVDNSMANSATASLRRLLVGQVNDDSTHESIGSLVLVSRTSEAKLIGGAGSMLARMHEVFRAGDSFGEVWCLPVKVTEGSKASGTVTVTGTATEAGLINLYVAGQRVRTTVTKGMTAAEVATAVAASIAAAVDLPVTAVAAAGVVTLMAKFTGDAGNDITLLLNRLGRGNGEITPAGLAVALAAPSGGTGSPDTATVLAALGSAPFEFIAQPWTDADTLDQWADFMGDTAGRWSWSQQLWGHVYTAKRGTLGELVAAGSARNDPHMTCHGFEKGVPQPCWEIVAAWVARTGVFISADVARPTQTGVLTGIEPASESERFLLTERQSLLTYGIATATYNGGAYRIERGVTTYQKNAYGQADNSYLDSETMHQSAYVIRDLQSVVTSKYGRHKLASDGTNVGDGEGVVTPKVIRAEMIGRYRALETEGIVENTEVFKEHLLVERDSNDPTRLNVLFPPDLVNQLRVFALLYQFRLQYPSS